MGVSSVTIAIVSQVGMLVLWFWARQGSQATRVFNARSKRAQHLNKAFGLWALLGTFSFFPALSSWLRLGILATGAAALFIFLATTVESEEEFFAKLRNRTFTAMTLVVTLIIAAATSISLGLLLCFYAAIAYHSCLKEELRSFISIQEDFNIIRCRLSTHAAHQANARIIRSESRRRPIEADRKAA